VPISDWFSNASDKILYFLSGAIFLPLIALTGAALKKVAVSAYTQVLGIFVKWASDSLGIAIASKWFVKRYAQIELSKDDTSVLLVPSAIDIRLNTDDIFVPLTLEQAGIGRAFDHKSILSAGLRTQIIGDPGSGKSSIIKRIFRDECRAIRDGKGGARFPVIVELRKLPQLSGGRSASSTKNKRAGQWLLKHISDTIALIGEKELNKSFDVYCQTSGILLLLDGLDEVPSDRFKFISDAINQVSVILSNKSQNNAVIITMRAQFHSQVRSKFQEKYSSVLLVRGFTPTDIFDFLNKWPFPSDKRRNVARIFSELTDRPSLREMCANPLVLAMYVARDQANRNNVTPESRTEFYESVSEELIYRRRAAATPDQKIPRKKRDDWKRFLAKVSLEHLLDDSQPANCLSWNSMVLIGMSFFGDDRDIAELAIHEISTYTGLITIERDSETVRFIHLTFCEFLAAWGAANLSSDGWGQLIDTHRRLTGMATSSRLSEVIPFAVRHLPDFRRSEAILDVLGFRDSRLSALSFLESKEYDHPEWSNFAADSMDKIIKEKLSENYSGWLANLHVFSVVLTDAILSVEGGRREKLLELQDQFYRLLLDSDGVPVSKLIATLARQDAAAAFRLSEYCQIDIVVDMPSLVISSCDQPPFLAIIIERAEKEVDKIDIWATVLTEAALRSHAVAQALSEMEKISAWSAVFSSGECISNRWSGIIKNDCALLQVIKIAFHCYSGGFESSDSRSIERARSGLIKKFFELPSYRHGLEFWSIPSIIAMLISSICIEFYLLDRISGIREAIGVGRYPHISLPYFIVGILLFPMALLYLKFVTKRHVLYSKVLGLGDVVEGILYFNMFPIRVLMKSSYPNNGVPFFEVKLRKIKDYIEFRDAYNVEAAGDG